MLTALPTAYPEDFVSSVTLAPMLLLLELAIQIFPAPSTAISVGALNPVFPPKMVVALVTVPEETTNSVTLFPLVLVVQMFPD